MKQQQRDYLNQICAKIRYLTIEEIAEVGVGHLGGCMSMVEALVVLYYKHMKIEPHDPKKEGRDRFVLSKAHAGPTLYAILADQGFFPYSLLNTLNAPGTSLPSHADMIRTPGVDMTAGSLGQGLSCAVGMAIGSKIFGDGALIYTMIGDGESNEGQIWEAAMYAAHKKLDNLIAFTDYNKMQLDGQTSEINDLEPLADKWVSFGWNSYVVDGHDVEMIDDAICDAKKKKQKPSMIILNTLKGKGVSFLEERWQNNHNTTISQEEKAVALAELKVGVE